MAELSKEQQRAIARARARARAAQDRQPKPRDPGDNLMARFNLGIATTLGAPVDITADVLRAIPGMKNLVPEDSFGGTKSIRRGMKMVGAPTPDTPPSGFLEQMAQGSGEAAGFLLPASFAAKSLSKGKGVVGGVAGAMNREIVERPVKAIAYEAAAGAGVGAGREVAEQQDLGPTGRALAEITGGLSPGASVAALRRAPLMKLGGKAFIPFTETGAKARAARRIQELSPDPKEASRAIRAYREDPISPAASTEQQGLLELEDAVLRGDPARRQRMSERTSEEVQRLRKSIEGESNIGAPKRFIENRKQRALAALDARVESATDEAAIALYDLGDVSAEDASNLVRDRLKAALDDARIEESRLWGRIPQNAKAPITRTKSTYKELKGKLSKAERDDMPRSAKIVLGGEGPSAETVSAIVDVYGQPIAMPSAIKGRKTTINELDGLYKKLGEEATQARANKEFNKARIAEAIREAILEDIASAEGGNAIQETIATARAFSKELNEKFRRGPTGKILGFGREGGPQLDPSLALEKTIGMGGQTAELGRRAISRAVQDDPTALEGMQYYLKDRFLRQVVDDGRVNPTKARTFIRNNAQLLDAFPGLRYSLKLQRAQKMLPVELQNVLISLEKPLISQRFQQQPDS